MQISRPSLWSICKHGSRMELANKRQTNKHTDKRAPFEGRRQNWQASRSDLKVRDLLLLLAPIHQFVAFVWRARGRGRARGRAHVGGPTRTCPHALPAIRAPPPAPPSCAASQLNSMALDALIHSRGRWVGRECERESLEINSTRAPVHSRVEGGREGGRGTGRALAIKANQITWRAGATGYEELGANCNWTRAGETSEGREEISSKYIELCNQNIYINIITYRRRCNRVVRSVNKLFSSVDWMAECESHSRPQLGARVRF